MIRKNKVRGTRDIINFSQYINLCNTIRSNLLLNNFQEISTPTFEYEELFTKNLGISTDIVNKEMYYVTHIYQNISDQKMVLRPELTAPMLRTYLQENIQTEPWKVFQIGSTFRHERPQKGRYREFFQCSIECINAYSIGYDLELLYMLYNIFNTLIPNAFELQINYISSSHEREIYKEALYMYCLEYKHLFPEAIQGKLSQKTILRVLDSKDESVQRILKDAPNISTFWNVENKQEWDIITEGLKKLDISFIQNERLIRGLDYYGGLIFEFVSNNLGAQNTFCGGGRYNELAKNIDPKKNIPALGAGIGIDRLLLILEESHNTIHTQDTFVSIILISSNFSALYSYALSFQKKLHEQNIKSKIYFDKQSLKSALKKANSENALLSCIIGDLEIQNNSIIIKEMHRKKEQIEIPIIHAVSYIKNTIDSI